MSRQMMTATKTTPMSGKDIVVDFTPSATAAVTVTAATASDVRSVLHSTTRWSSSCPMWPFVFLHEVRGHMETRLMATRCLVCRTPIERVPRVFMYHDGHIVTFYCSIFAFPILVHY